MTAGLAKTNSLVKRKWALKLDYIHPKNYEGKIMYEAQSYEAPLHPTSHLLPLFVKLRVGVHVVLAQLQGLDSRKSFLLDFFVSVFDGPSWLLSNRSIGTTLRSKLTRVSSVLLSRQ